MAPITVRLSPQGTLLSGVMMVVPTLSITPSYLSLLELVQTLLLACFSKLWEDLATLQVLVIMIISHLIVQHFSCLTFNKANHL